MKRKTQIWSSLILVGVGVCLVGAATVSFRRGNFNADRFGYRLITAKDDPYQYWAVVGAWSVLGACAIYSGIITWRK